MSYSSLPFTFKLFQLTTLTGALALAGCGGGDGTDIIAPAPDLGVKPGTGDGNNNGGGNGGVQNPASEPAFFIQKLSTAPTIIELSDEEAIFTVTVKAVEVVSGGAVVGKAVSLQVKNSETNGITIEGQSVQTTDNDGNAVYKLRLKPSAVADKGALIENGFTLVASAKKADGTAITPQELKVSVNRKGSGDGTQIVVSKLTVKPNLKTSSVSNGILNPFGDAGTFSVEIKDEKGTLAPDVTVGLGIIPLEGVSISPASQVTDSKGIANFNIKIDENLSETARDNLLKGITYTLNIREKSGASKSVTDSLKVGLPVSDYNLNVTGNSNKLSAYSDTQSLTLTAAAISAAVPTKIEGAKVAFRLNNAPIGISLSSSQLTLDNRGQAIVTLSIAPGLSDAERKALAENGISYTATLSEPNHSVTAQTFESSVEIPLAKNIISFEGSDKKQISSSGGSAIVSFRVNNQNGGAVANQLVSATLPTALTSKGLLTIDGSTEQTTNDKGVVSYVVRVPAGLSEAQKAALEKASNFALAVKAVEASGASSMASSSPIVIGSEIGQSDITLTAQSIPTTVNILENQFKLQIAAKRKNGSAADGRTVKLVLNEGSSTGVTIQGNQQTTNGSGIAEFNIAISQSLTQAQRDQLIKTGIGYTAIVTDQDGTQSKIIQTIQVEQPLSAIQFASIETPTISELGGKGTISVKLSTKDKQLPVTGQTVAIQLGKVAIDYGVTINTESAITDFNG
ncbi:hypothetical protein, partial [Psychrobacter sp.]|uniref:hypothetical protein n=1 Tax=Psychrobacter sp. TaxID=56811 RepID=UPI003567CB03